MQYSGLTLHQHTHHLAVARRGSPTDNTSVAPNPKALRAMTTRSRLPHLPSHAHNRARSHARAHATVGAVLLALACTKSRPSATDSAVARADSTVAAAMADSAPKSTLALPIVAEPARDADLVLRVTTTGQVRTDAAVKLRADVAGTIAQLLVRPGAHVTRAQALLRLDAYPFDLAVREAQATADDTAIAPAPVARAMSRGRRTPPAIPPVRRGSPGKC